MSCVDKEPRDIQLIDNLLGYALNSWNLDNYPIHHPDRYANRFQQMADNLIWLAEVKYPNEKIIVRLHNGHAVKNLKKLGPFLPDSLIGKSPNVGSILSNHFGDDLFIMGSTYYSGTYSKWDFKPIGYPSTTER